MTDTLIKGDEPETLTTKELAQYLFDKDIVRVGDKPVSTQTIRNWMGGGMPCKVKGERAGPSNRFDADECVSWLRSNRTDGRGGIRVGAGRPPKRKGKHKNPKRAPRGESVWRTEAGGDEPRLVSDEMIEEADRRRSASDRLGELAKKTAAEAAIDPDVISLEYHTCKLTHADLVLLAHLPPDVSGLHPAAVQRLEKLETIQSRQIERLKALGELVPVRDVRREAAEVYGELRQALDNGAKELARELAATLGLDGEGHKNVERMLTERVRVMVEKVREIGEGSAAEAA